MEGSCTLRQAESTSVTTTMDALSEQSITYIESLGIAGAYAAHPLPSEHYSEKGELIVSKRYAIRNESDEPMESIRDVFVRGAYAVAQPYITDPEDVSDDMFDDNVQHTCAQERFVQAYKLMASGEFMPNSPFFTGALRPLGNVMACFVLPIEDDLALYDDSIFATLRRGAQIQQTGGGNGFSFSHLRPKGSFVSTSCGRSTGPVGFMKVYDVAFGMVAQGGTRRGANMAVLRVDHPDIVQFIECKAKEGDISNFNISVGITNAFMRAVETNGTYDLIDPHTRRIVKTVDARSVYDRIVEHAHANGEPGVLFLDTANASHPLRTLYELEATNPCLHGDTWVTTRQCGPQRIKDVVGKPLDLLIDGQWRSTTQGGFFQTAVTETWTIETDRGERVRVTDNHKMCVLSEGKKRVWKQVNELATGDRLVLSNNRTRNLDWGGRGTFEQGYLAGYTVGDGTIYVANDRTRAIISVWSKADGYKSVMEELVRCATTIKPTARFGSEIADHGEFRMSFNALAELLHDYGIDQRFKGVSAAVQRASVDFQRGFIRALFDADGFVQGTPTKGGSIRLSQSDVATLERVQSMLLRFGIASTIYKNRRGTGERWLPDGKGGSKLYHCKAQHELCIAKDNMRTFQDVIGLSNKSKCEKLAGLLSSYKRALYKDSFVTRLTSLSKDKGVSPVYDCQIDHVDHAFEANGFVVHNCGEQFLGPYENCCLGSINMLKVYDQATKGINWDKLRRITREATRMLDTIVTIARFPFSELRRAADRTRRIGLGMMNLATLLFKLGIGYGTDESCSVAAVLMEWIRYWSMVESVALAKEDGAFELFDQSSFSDGGNGNPGAWIPAPRSPEMHKQMCAELSRPSVDWYELDRDICTHGLRNLNNTTLAPTGTIATVTGCEAYGCEPVFALGYKRHVNDAEGDLVLEYQSESFVDALKAYYASNGLSDAMMNEALEDVMHSGSCQNTENVPDCIKRVFKVSADITPEEHIKLQAHLQAFVCNSISKTCNLPAGATRDDVDRCIRLGWKSQCKGLTVYVTGSRQKVVLETAETCAKKVTPTGDDATAATTTTTATTTITMSPLPSTAIVPFKGRSREPNEAVLPSKTFKLPTPQGKLNVTITEKDGEPFEVFINVGKAGSDQTAESEALARLISYALRVYSPVPRLRRARDIAHQLARIGGAGFSRHGRNRVLSVPDGVHFAMDEWLKLDAAAKSAKDHKRKRHTHGTKLADLRASVRAHSDSDAEEEEDVEEDDEDDVHRQQHQTAPHTIVADAMTTPLTLDRCRECGNNTLMRVEGCVKCINTRCNYTAC